MENLDTNFAVCGYCTQTCLCITDSLSDTTYVETNDQSETKQLHLSPDSPVIDAWVQQTVKRTS